MKRRETLLLTADGCDGEVSTKGEGWTADRDMTAYCIAINQFFPRGTADGIPRRHLC